MERDRAGRVRDAGGFAGGGDALILRRIRKVARHHLRRWRRIDERVVTLAPAGRPRGRVLLSYIIDPFLLRPGHEPAHDHTHHWESREMARAWVERGYTVEAISWLNAGFVPREPYAYLVDVRYNLERLAPLVGAGCVKLMHAETAHWSVQNAAEMRRLDDLARRRGIRLAPRRQMAPGRAIETADAATVLGNRFTIGSYAFAGKPMHRVPISTPLIYPWPDGKDWARAATSFLWFGSGGLVHKGLDLVLEAFAGAPELDLFVVGPVANERDFARAYARELYGLPNVRTLDWLDVAGSEFAAVARACGAVVYPSCSEGGGGSVITCMHAGMLPVVSEEASVDVSPGYGVLLADSSVETIRAAARALAARGPREVEAMARAAWEWARANHTRERFAAGYRAAIAALD